MLTYLVTNLQVEITGLGMKPQVNSLSVVTDDVFGPWVLISSPSHQFLHSVEKKIQNKIYLFPIKGTSSLFSKSFTNLRFLFSCFFLVFDPPVNVEWSDQVWKCHVLGNGAWNTDLINSEVWIWGDDSSCREINTLSHEVTPDATLFTLQSLFY